MDNDKRLQKWISDVRRGMYPLVTVLGKSARDKIESQLLKEYSDGTLPESGLEQLVKYQVDLIKINRRSIDDVPTKLKELTEQALKDNMSPDFYTRKGSDNESTQ